MTPSDLDVQRGYAFLGLQDTYAELTILHPEYRRGDVAWNRERDAWPRTMYVTSSDGLLDIVREYAGTRAVLYGVNPRPSILAHPDGRLRSAKEADITISQNLVLDIDLEGVVSPARLDRLKAFLRLPDEYFVSLGLQRPVRAASGRGSHLVFAYPPILVREHPNTRGALRWFRDEFVTAFRHDLARLEARVDSTQDLRRSVRVYGTAKPGVGVNSRLYANARREDAGMREYLLRRVNTPNVIPAAEAVLVGAELPLWFQHLLAEDHRVHALWHNTGKPEGSDVTTSGYDFSLVRDLVRRGHNNPNDLATIIALRPFGSVARHQKGVEYVQRTVANALAKPDGVA